MKTSGLMKLASLPIALAVAGLVSITSASAKEKSPMLTLPTRHLKGCSMPSKTVL